MRSNPRQVLQRIVEEHIWWGPFGVGERFSQARRWLERGRPSVDFPLPFLRPGWVIQRCSADDRALLNQLKSPDISHVYIPQYVECASHEQGPRVFKIPGHNLYRVPFPIKVLP